MSDSPDTPPEPEVAPASSSTPAPTPAPAPTTRAPQPIVLVGLGLIAVALLVYGQQRSVSRLDSEVEALKEDQRKMAVNLGAMKGKGGLTSTVVDISGAPSIGPESAAVTLIEFSDYECPFCIKHFQHTMPQIDEHYVQSGKIRYVFKDLPIADNHPQAIRAHEAAHCAAEQQKFWLMHRRLFSPPGSHGKAALESRAAEAGLDVTAFKACIAERPATTEIEASGDLARSLGADGTPAFFVAIRDSSPTKVRIVDQLSGALPYSAFERSLDAALAQAGK